jgi:two-component system chemotaxis response regulator CheY
MRILVADDDGISRRVLGKMLSPWGEVEFAADGMEVLTRFKDARGEGKPFSLLCLDINMPRLDGQQTVELIREMERDGEQRTVVFMVSADSTPTNVIHAKVRGQCAAFLVKPIDKARLAEAMNKAGLILPGDASPAEQQ